MPNIFNLLWNGYIYTLFFTYKRMKKIIKQTFLLNGKREEKHPLHPFHDHGMISCPSREDRRPWYHCYTEWTYISRKLEEATTFRCQMNENNMRYNPNICETESSFCSVRTAIRHVECSPTLSRAPEYMSMFSSLPRELRHISRLSSMISSASPLPHDYCTHFIFITTTHLLHPFITLPSCPVMPYNPTNHRQKLVAV